MLPDKNIMCPATGFAKSCRSIVSEHECPKLVKVLGTNVQTGETIDKIGCVDSFLHLLLIENSRKQHETGAAIESFRNEVRRQHDVTISQHYISNIVPRPGPALINGSANGAHTSIDQE